MKDTEYTGRMRPWSPAAYRIEVEGRWNESWSALFASMRITTRRGPDRAVVTCLTGRVQDQLELCGLLNSLAELHLPILNVSKINAEDHCAEDCDEKP